MIFQEPIYFLFLLALIPMFLAYKRARTLRIKIPSLLRLKAKSVKVAWWKRHSFFFLRSCSVIFLCLALARPQSGRSQRLNKTEGLDIMLVVDTSGSMKALDFSSAGERRNRLEVVEQVLGEFVQARPDDRIGLVVFGNHAFAQVPLTLDHDVLLRYIDSAQIGMAGDATAIGDALGVALNRLKNSEGKSKLIILLTDGENNEGKLSPQEMAAAAKAFGVKIYAVGVGSKEPVLFPTQFGYQKVLLPLDEKLLQEISTATNGKYFVARDKETLSKIYSTIDQLEKSKVEVKVFHQYEEHFSNFVFPAILFILMELMLRLTRLRRVGL
ncbi:MAG: VWA domain-containing protein [Oligoflexales bacterium]|nr:VWA domain-containing protein [Oligoflexales bacterium]